MVLSLDNRPIAARQVIIIAGKITNLINTLGKAALHINNNEEHL